MRPFSKVETRRGFARLTFIVKIGGSVFRSTKMAFQIDSNYALVHTLFTLHKRKNEKIQETVMLKNCKCISETVTYSMSLSVTVQIVRDTSCLPFDNNFTELTIKLTAVGSRTSSSF